MNAAPIMVVVRTTATTLWAATIALATMTSLLIQMAIHVKVMEWSTTINPIRTGNDCANLLLTIVIKIASGMNYI